MKKLIILLITAFVLCCISCSKKSNDEPSLIKKVPTDVVGHTYQYTYIDDYTIEDMPVYSKTTVKFINTDSAFVKNVNYTVNSITNTITTYMPDSGKVAISKYNAYTDKIYTFYNFIYIDDKVTSGYNIRVYYELTTTNPISTVMTQLE